MTAALSILAVAFAAFCVWLTVRIINRRERWAKWTLAGIIGLPVLYVASFGPVVWLTDRGIVSRDWATAIYLPIFTELSADEVLWQYGDLGCRDPYTMFASGRRAGCASTESWGRRSRGPLTAPLPGWQPPVRCEPE